LVPYLGFGVQERFSGLERVKQLRLGQEAASRQQNLPQNDVEVRPLERRFRIGYLQRTMHRRLLLAQQLELVQRRRANACSPKHRHQAERETTKGTDSERPLSRQSRSLRPGAE
jgi:hypothetical protein